MAASPTPRHNGGPRLFDVHPDDRMIYAQWHIRDYLHGVQSLKPDQIGLYSIILNLIYDNMGRLKDNDAFIAGHCQCGVRYYRKLKDSLIAEGKIYVFDGYIYNDRAIIEIEKFCKAMQAKRDESANKSAAALLREQRRRERQDDGQEGNLVDARGVHDGNLSGAPQEHDRSTACAPQEHGVRTIGARQVPDACTTGNEFQKKHNGINEGDTTVVAQDRPKNKNKTRQEEDPPQTPFRGLPREWEPVVDNGANLSRPPPPDPNAIQDGETDHGNGVFEAPERIRHRDFTINLQALAMRLVTANLGLSKNEADKLAREFALASALQWASEIRNGKLSRDVVPGSIVNALSASIIRLRSAAASAKPKPLPSYMYR